VIRWLRAVLGGLTAQPAVEEAAPAMPSGVAPVQLRPSEPTTGHAKEVDAETLQRLIDESQSPLLIHFTADWCGPCRGMAPHLEAFAQARAAELPVLKLDIDEHPEVARRFMVRAVPTLMLLREGRVLGVHAGALSAAQLSRFVDANLAA
jgi:thioredoxin